MCEVLRVDAFTKIPGKGNSAGVVLNGDNYTKEEMQLIAKEANFSETVFICQSSVADYRFYYFMPLKETTLCGHATIAGVFMLCQGAISRKLTVETQVGILSLYYDAATQEVRMEQKNAQFKSFEGDQLKLCEILGIELIDLDDTLPVVYGNTGAWTLIVPLKESELLDKMAPISKRFPDVLEEEREASIHPFAPLEKNTRSYIARHFSSPFSGVIEDSVTGTASGVMGAYLHQERFLKEKELEILVHQGKHVNQEGQVTVYSEKLSEDIICVSISGTAVLGKKVWVKF